MQELRRRPLLGACGGLIVGLTSIVFPANLLFLAPLLLAMGSLGHRLAIVAAFLLGLALAPDLQSRSQVGRPYFDGSVSVMTVPRLKARIQTCEVRDGNRTFLMEAPRTVAIGLADEVRVRGRVAALGEADTRLLAHRLSGKLVAFSDGVTVSRRGALPFQWGASARLRFLALTSKWMTPDAAAMTDAICFESSGLVGDDVKVQLQRSGTVFILSASGLHIFLLAWMLNAAFSPIPVPRIVQILVLLAILLVFAGASGFTPSVVRASIAVTLAAAAYLVRREPDLLSAMAAAGIGYLVWQPGSVYDVGFQLSFLVVAGFALQPFRRRRYANGFRRAVGGVLQAVHASGVAFLWSAPILAYSFGLVSLTSVVAAPFIAIALVPIMLLGVAALAVSTVSEGVATTILADVVHRSSGGWTGSFKLSPLPAGPL